MDIQRKASTQAFKTGLESIRDGTRNPPAQTAANNAG